MSLLSCSCQAKNCQSLSSSFKELVIRINKLSFFNSGFFSIGLHNCSHQCFLSWTAIHPCLNNLISAWSFTSSCLTFQWLLSAYFTIAGSWEVWAQVMQLVGCFTRSWAPAGKVTASCMLRQCLPLASQECFGMFLLPSVQSHFSSHLAHPCLCFPAVFMCCSRDRQSLLPLEHTAWPRASEVNRQIPPHCLAAPFYTWRQNMQPVPQTPDKWIK